MAGGERKDDNRTQYQMWKSRSYSFYLVSGQAQTNISLTSYKRLSEFHRKCLGFQVLCSMIELVIQIFDAEVNQR